MVEKVKDLIFELSLEEGFSEAIWKLSSDLISRKDVDYNFVLKTIAESAGVNRAFFYNVDMPGNFFYLRASWKGSESSDFLQRIEFERFPSAVRFFQENKPLIIEDSAEIAQEMSAEKTLMERVRIKALLAIPFSEEGELKGFVGLSDSLKKVKWHARTVRFLKVVGNLIYSLERRKQMDEKLKRFAAIVEQIDEAIIVTDPLGMIQFVNSAFERMSGYTADEVIGKSPAILGSGENPTQLYREMWAAISSGKAWRGRMINRRSNGSFYELENLVMPIKDSGGAIINYIALQRDVTEQMQMENRLKQAEKMEAVGTLAAGIAHEINTPMQFIMDNTTFLHEAFEKIVNFIDVVMENGEMQFRGEDSPVRSSYDQNRIDFLKEEVPYSLKDNMEGIERVRKIVKAMKDFAHPSESEMSFQDINKAIKSTMVITKNVWKYDVNMELDLEKGLPQVLCLIDDINQMFLNLIVNATDAIIEKRKMSESVIGSPAEKGTIKIRTYSLGERVRIEVSDTGTGIPESIQERIFEPFYNQGCREGNRAGIGICPQHRCDKASRNHRCRYFTGKGDNLYHNASRKGP